MHTGAPFSFLEESESGLPTNLNVIKSYITPKYRPRILYKDRLQPGPTERMDLPWVQYLNDVQTIVGSYLDQLIHLTKSQRGVVPPRLEGLTELLASVLHNTTLWEYGLRHRKGSPEFAKLRQQRLHPPNMEDALLDPSILAHSPLLDSSAQGNGAQNNISNFSNPEQLPDVRNLCPALRLAKDIACAEVNKTKIPPTRHRGRKFSKNLNQNTLQNNEMSVFSVATYGCNVIPVLLKKCKLSPGIV